MSGFERHFLGVPSWTYFLKVTLTVIWSPLLLVSSTLIFVPDPATFVEAQGFCADQ
jgi:hypothetical protein